MNIKTLSSIEVQEWLASHNQTPIHELSFKKSPFPEIEMRDLIQQIQGRQIISKKIPSLHQKGILFPPKVNLEQTSSKTTADYKANLLSGKIIVDITGGLGIDCISFATKFEHVYHLEENQDLQKIAEHNFKILKLDNINSFNIDGIQFLNGFDKPIDVLYIDPSRRDSTKNRVFLLEDLTPNIVIYQELFEAKANVILFKLSPLIDLKYLFQVIQHIAEIHVVAIRNEVKEVLVKVNSSRSKFPKIYAVNLETNQSIFEFSPIELDAQHVLIGKLDKYLYEPNASIQKSGGNEILARQYGLEKLHSNTQLFTSNILHESFPGRIFEVGAKVKSPKKELKNTSIMAIHRNFPESLAQLRKKYKFTTDGVQPVLFTTNLDEVIIHRMQRVII